MPSVPHPPANPGECGLGHEGPCQLSRPALARVLAASHEQGHEPAAACGPWPPTSAACLDCVWVMACPVVHEGGLCGGPLELRRHHGVEGCWRLAQADPAA